MKIKLFKSFLVVLLFVFIGMIYNVSFYVAKQDFAKVATEQVNNDNSYYTLKTQKSVNNVVSIIFCCAALGSLSLFYFIWKPSKEEDEQEEEQ